MRWGRKTTISLIHGEYLLEGSEEAERIRKEIDNILDSFRNGDFSDIARFESLIEEAFNIIKHNLQLHAKEEERLKKLEDALKEFFHNHLFGKLEDEMLEAVREAFHERLTNNKQTVRHGKKPVSKYLRTLFPEKEIDKTALADARKALKLQKDEEETKNQLYNLMMVLVRERGLMTATEKHHEKRLHEALEHFATVVAQEYRALYDVEVDETLEEADLIHDIDDVLQADIPRQHRKKLKEIRKRIDKFVKKDIRELKKQAKIKTV